MEKCNLREKEDGTVTVEYTMKKRTVDKVRD